MDKISSVLDSLQKSDVFKGLTIEQYEEVLKKSSHKKLPPTLIASASSLTAVIAATGPNVSCRKPACPFLHCQEQLQGRRRRCPEVCGHLKEFHSKYRTILPMIRNDYHGIGCRSRKKPPLGPPSGSVASQTGVSAPCSGDSGA